jgi:hypothetical protein
MIDSLHGYHRNIFDLQPLNIRYITDTPISRSTRGVMFDLQIFVRELWQFIEFRSNRNLVCSLCPLLAPPPPDTDDCSKYTSNNHSHHHTDKQTPVGLVSPACVVTGLGLDIELSRAQSISWYLGFKICRDTAVGSLGGIEVDDAGGDHLIGLQDSELWIELVRAVVGQRKGWAEGVAFDCVRTVGLFGFQVVDVKILFFFLPN